MSDSQDPILTQLKRIHGQLGGVIAMYEDERQCVDIVRQVVAVRNSLARVARDLLTTEATRCTQCQDVDSLNEVLREVFKQS